MKKGNKYYNNGQIEVILSPDDNVPDGYIAGRLTANSVHIYKDMISKRVSKTELENYLSAGWALGRASFSEEAITNIRDARKKFFDSNPNWTNCRTWKKGHKTWNKGVPMSLDARNRLSQVKLGSHLSEESRVSKNRKERETKLRNNSFNKSKPEDLFYQTLISIFGKEDIYRQYLEERYPFKCDFYIKSLDMFIECNYYWTHGDHRFDSSCEEDNKKLDCIRSKQDFYINDKGIKHKNLYFTAEEVWTKSDVLKYEVAKLNNLDYVILYNKEQENDFIRRIQNNHKIR